MDDCRTGAGTGARMDAAVGTSDDLPLGEMGMRSLYRVECLDENGRVVWVEEVENLVTNAGLNDLLSKYFKGSAYTAAFFLGLKGTGTPVAADTLASHASWPEVTSYTGNRQAVTLGTVASQSVSNSGAVNSFAVTGADLVAGGFLCTVATGTAGILYGVADFAAPRPVQAAYTLNVTVTLTAASV